jgi:cobalamin-dependent methionine synthase I
MMAEGAGFEIHDLGVDQNVDKFLAAADRVKPQIIGMSALLTTTMTYMKTVIDRFHADGRTDIKFAVGGAPISQMFADEIGADGYGANASAAVDLFLRLSRGDAAPAAVAQAAAPADARSDGGTRPGKVTRFKVLYWQEIPSQVKAEDDAGNEVNLELPRKFADYIDQVAAKRGFQSSDAYLAEWKWADEQERPGSAREVAEAVKAELEAQAKW